MIGMTINYDNKKERHHNTRNKLEEMERTQRPSNIHTYIYTYMRILFCSYLNKSLHLQFLLRFLCIKTFSTMTVNLPTLLPGEKRLSVQKHSLETLARFKISINSIIEHSIACMLDEDYVVLDVLNRWGTY